MFEDQQVNCSDCGSAFIFTAAEQEFYAGKGFSAPKRCKPCREQRKAQGGGGGRGGPGGGGGAPRGDRMGNGGGGGGGGGFRGGDRGPREMHDATCSSCGKQTQVPFRPRGDRPVYCRDCFGARR